MPIFTLFVSAWVLFKGAFFLWVSLKLKCPSTNKFYPVNSFAVLWFTWSWNLREIFLLSWQNHGLKLYKIHCSIIFRQPLDNYRGYVDSRVFIRPCRVLEKHEIVFSSNMSKNRRKLTKKLSLPTNKFIIEFVQMHFSKLGKKKNLDLTWIREKSLQNIKWT